MWFENKVMLNSGCGIVAGYDAVMRLLDEDEFSKDDYMAAPSTPCSPKRGLIPSIDVKPFLRHFYPMEKPFDRL